MQIQQFLSNHLGSLLTCIATIAITLLLVGIVRRMFKRFLGGLDPRDTADRTNYYFLRYVVIAMIYIIGFTLAIYAIPALRAIGTTLLAGAGVLALAVSFASQQALSNVVSGMFIVIFKPFKINDKVMIKSNDLEGVVEDITLRHTVIKNRQNNRIIIPNSVISNDIIVNADYSDGEICKYLDFGIGYESSIELARRIITEEAMKHPLTLDHRNEKQKASGQPIVPVRVMNLGESSVDLRAFIWVKNHASGLQLCSDLLESIKLRFDREGIELPYPHRSVILQSK